MVLRNPILTVLKPNYNPIGVFIKGLNFTYNWVRSALNLQVHLAGSDRASVPPRAPPSLSRGTADLRVAIPRGAALNPKPETLNPKP